MPKTLIVPSAVLAAFLLSAAMARAENEPTAVYTMNVDGSDVKLLAHVDGYGEHASPRWSHDGKRVAFDALPTAGGSRKIFLVGADGKELREIGTGSMPAWSPDDKQFACHVWPGAGRSQLFVQNLDGESRTDLGPGNCPQWSPDGGTVATTNGKNLILFDAITGAQTELFAEPYFEVFKGFQWSPDGKTLAVTVRAEQGAQRQLWIVSAAGAAQGATLRLKSNLGGFVSFSPDGKQLIFATDNKIHIAEVAGTGRAKLVPGQRGKNRNPDWSPDGKRIVFVSDREQK